MSFGKPKTPKPTSAQKALESQQVLQATQLDQQENDRRKRLLTAQQGVRAYTGSPMFRASPANTAGSAGAASSNAAANPWAGLSGSILGRGMF